MSSSCFSRTPGALHFDMVDQRSMCRFLATLASLVRAAALSSCENCGMCGRHVSLEDFGIERFRHIGRLSNNPFQRRFNVSRTQLITIPRVDRDTGEIKLVSARWGLIPNGWKDEADVEGRARKIPGGSAVVEPTSGAARSAVRQSMMSALRFWL
jgi:hypothetical protein